MNESRLEFDPIALEILWSRLIAIADEQAATIRRTAFSNVVRESHDFTCVLLTREGDLLAQPYQSIPGFTRCASVVGKHFIAKWRDWHPGDVAITNDPWLAAGHLHDVAIAVPVFHRSKIIAFSANIAHQADIGGRGYSADANSIFEEGLAIPPMKLYRAGRPVDEIFEIIRENVRVPDQVLGDIGVQVAAARAGAERLAEVAEEAGLDDLDAVSAAMLARSEAAMRSAIAALPEGLYESEGVMDGYDSPLVIRLKATIGRDGIVLDFAGTSPQVPKGINSCFNFTYGYAAYAVKAAIEPRVANNEGCYRPIRMLAPDASLVNSRRPAPGNSRGRVGHMIVPVVFGALSRAMPARIPAEPGAPAPRLNFFGERDDGSEFQCLVITSGGMGGRAHGEGHSSKAFPTNTSMASIEVMEASAPLRFLRRELVPDSGGAGRHRGGLAQEIVIQAVGKNGAYVSTSAERIEHPPRGYAGGADGMPAALSRNGGFLAPKARSALAPGDVVTVRTAGGGGYGDPAKRNPAAIEQDVAQGYVTEAEAGRAYPQYGLASAQTLRGKVRRAG